MRQGRGASASDAPEEIVLSTEMVEPRLRNDLWREISRPFFETMPCPDEPKAVLEGSLRSRAVGSLLIGPTSFNRQQYCRDRRTILQGGLNQYFVQLFVAGTLEADCEGKIISVGPGDICVFDLARAFRSRVGAGSTLSLVLPREQVDKVASGRNLHGLVLKAGSPIARLLAGFITSLSDASAELGSADTQAIEAAAVALIASALVHQAPMAAAGDPALAQILRRRVLDFIDANLSASDLGPATLMRRFQVSRAHLYRMFATDGGVATIVREKRLDASFRELVRADAPPLPITQLARAFGFSSSSQFHRAFRARFVMTPSEARHEAPATRFADQRLAFVQGHFDRYAQQLGLGRRGEGGSKTP